MDDRVLGQQASRKEKRGAAVKVTVTAQSHPALFHAFELISHDRGTQAGHASYEVPATWALLVPRTEAELTPLTAEELETFAIGEESEAQAVALRQQLVVAPLLLNAFFSEWSDAC